MKDAFLPIRKKHPKLLSLGWTFDFLDLPNKVRDC